MKTISLHRKSGAATRYDESFAFDSLAVDAQGALWGIRADGIYKVEGKTDAGAKIAAEVDFGDEDFGSPFEKHVVAAYHYGEIDGTLALTITERGEAYEYRSRNSRQEDGGVRFDTGKGLRANYFGLKLANISGADFLTTALMVKTSESKRRI